MAEKPGYYAVLPAEVRYDTELSSTAKLLYAEITALSSAYGFCTAKNKYFAELYGVTIRAVQKLLEQLAAKEYITIERDKKPRRIFISTVKKSSWQGEKKFMVEGEKKFTPNNNITSINNKFNNICPEQAPEPAAAPPVITLTLNDKTEYPITQEAVDEMRNLYPNVDVLQELKKMRGWCTANPTRRKTRRGIERFINSWLCREQDKAGVKMNSGAAAPAYNYADEEDFSEFYGITL